MNKQFKRFTNLLTKKQKNKFLIITIFMIISAILTQLIPLIIGYLTDDILKNTHLSFTKILPFLIFLLIISIVNEGIKIIRRLMVEDVATSAEKTARITAINHLLKAPLSYFKQNMTGNIHGRLNRSLDGLTKLIKLTFMDLCPSIFTSIAAIIVIFIKLPFVLALSMMLVIPIGLYIIKKQIQTQKGIRIKLLETKANMDGTLVELLNGITVIRITDNVDFETARFQLQSNNLKEKEMKHHLSMAKYDTLKILNESFFRVFIIGISVYLAANKVISIGAVLTAILCWNELINPLKELHRILDELSESSVQANDYFKTIELEPDFSYQAITKKLQQSNNKMIDIQKMSIKYKEQVIIDNLTLSINKGDFIGFVGSSGCGKSTLMKTITKLEPSTGKIYLNNQNLSNLTRSDIANIIAYVPQDPFIIRGTIKENICYGIKEKIDDKQIIEAATSAHLDKFINSLPNKYNTIIDEGGQNLSGGQKQRISLARIFLKKPSILILDEATSALDNTTEKYIQKEIEKLREKQGTTILSIAHRLSTLKNCDHILVMDHGKIIQTGTFQELKQKKGQFQDMYNGIVK